MIEGNLATPDLSNAMDPELKGFLENMMMRLDLPARLDHSFDRLAARIQSVKESLERQFREIGETLNGMSARLDEIAEAANYEELERHCCHLPKRQ